VRDTGIGIPTGSPRNIIDMFSQVDWSIERSTGCLRIGLALVKGPVETHDGTVRAASAGDGLGNIFTVTLPGIGDDKARLTRLESRYGVQEPVSQGVPIRHNGGSKC
jgi:signal transduction histidine kinase